MELRKTQTKQIDEFTYEVTQLGAITSSKVFVRVLKMFGPMLLALKSEKLDAVALSGLNEDDLLYLINAFTAFTNVPGVGPLDRSFDSHFAGRFMALIKWLLFCLEVNYGDFLKGGSLAAVAQAAGLNASPSTSQTTSTGPSTAS